jgi:hypothetical protein
MVGAYIGLASLVVIALLTGWPLFSGLWRGVIYSKRVGYSRVDDPSSFWFYASGYALAFAASAGLLMYFGFEAALG